MRSSGANSLEEFKIVRARVLVQVDADTMDMLKVMGMNLPGVKLQQVLLSPLLQQSLLVIALGQAGCHASMKPSQE